MINSYPVAVKTAGVLSGKTINMLNAGVDHACAVVSDNQIYCWGGNANGQLGVSSATINPSLEPLVITMNTIAGPIIYAGENTYKLQFAARSAASCTAQSTGFADVTAATTVAYNDNPSVSNGMAISSTANDPVPAASEALQNYQDLPGNFTNTSTIASGKVGMWDYSLKTINATNGTNYCIRMVYSDGTALEMPQYFPEITVGSGTPTVAVAFVDGTGTPIAAPTFAFSGTSQKTTSQTTTGTFADSTRKLRISNTTYANGWSVSLAATGGNTAVWKRSDNLAQYAFNSGSGGGQLSVNPSSSTLTPQGGCSTTGISFGSSANFLQGSQDSITLLTASNASQQNCYWDLTGTALTQTIPAQQAAGSYTIDMTATVTAF